jgi:hypothetical protein
LHGSAAEKDGKCSTRRWVVNPWFIAIQPDHETLDLPEVGTWSYLAACHRDLVAPNTTPSGQINTHGRPLDRFPASLPLRHISHLSDALVGQNRWDNPLVRREAEIVLGENDDAARVYVQESRQKMIQKYKENMRLIREIEKARYGENSFFRLCEQGLFREPQYEGDYIDRKEDSSDDDGDDNGDNDGDDESDGMAMSDDEMAMSSDE